MERIETLPVIQMSYLSHICLPAVAVAGPSRTAGGKHLLLTSSLGGSFDFSVHSDL